MIVAASAQGSSTGLVPPWPSAQQVAAPVLDADIDRAQQGPEGSSSLPVPPSPGTHKTPQLNNHHHFGWILLLSVALTFVAGFTNAFGLIYTGSSISGVTGPITTAAILWGRLNFQKGLEGFYLMLSVFCFAIGSFIGGLITPSRKMKFQLRYGFALLIESGLLLIGTMLLTNNFILGARLFYSVAMGLQNGLATYFSGAVLRLTHMTGIVSDIGMIVGETIRRRAAGGVVANSPDLWKLKLYLPILGSFFLGSLIGALLSFDPLHMFAPTGIVFVLSLGYLAFRLRVHYVRIEKGEVDELFPQPEPFVPPDVLAESSNFLVFEEAQDDFFPARRVKSMFEMFSESQVPLPDCNVVVPPEGGAAAAAAAPPGRSVSAQTHASRFVASRPTMSLPHFPAKKKTATSSQSVY